MPKPKKIASKPAQGKRLSGGHRLLKTSLLTMRSRAWLIFKVAGLAALVNILIQLTLAEAASAYQGLWFVFSNCALIWLVRHLSDKKVELAARNAYYQGTAPALRFLLVLIVIGLAGIPFSIGAFIYSTASVLNEGSNSVGAQLVTGGVWLVFALASLWLLARLFFALLVVTLPNTTPLQSLRLSWGVTRRKTLAVLGRLALFFFYTGLLLVGLVVLLSATPVGLSLSQSIIEVTATLFVLPLFYLYLFNMYQELE